MTDAIAHPDDEQLSAALDGEDEPATRQHLRHCAACVGRLAELDNVRQAVGGAVPPAPPGLAEQAVAAALSAWTDERAGAGTEPAAERPGPGHVPPPLPRHRPTGPGAGRPAGDDLAPVIPLRRRVPTWALGAAAAVAALLVAVPVLTHDSDGGGRDQVASAQLQDEAVAEKALVDGGDLGAQSDPRALNQVLQSAVAPNTSLARPGPAAGAAEDASRASPEPGATAAAPAPASAPADSTAVTTPSQFANPTSGQPAPAPCAATVRSEYGQGLGALVYQANLVWRGTPAVVLAYELAGPAAAGPGRRAFVMARDGCELLVAQGF